MNKRFNNALAALLAAVLTFIACSCKGSDIVMTIGKTNVGKEEFQMVMSALRNEVIVYYSENHNETDFSESFWNRKYGSKEKTPIELLREKTCDKIKENHAILKMAKDKNIIPDDSYEYIRKAFNSENSSRSDKYGSNQTIYGVTRFSMEDYYDYVISNCSVELRNIAMKDLSDSEISEYYEKNKDEMFCKPYAFECEQVFLEGYSDSDEIKAAAKRIVKSAENGADFKSTVSSEKMTLTTEEYDMSLIRTLSIRFPAITEALGSMNKGDVRVVEEAPDAYILKVISKSEKAYIPLGEISENVKTYAALEKFDSAVEKEKKETKCKVNKGNMKKTEPTG